MRFLVNAPTRRARKRKASARRSTGRKRRTAAQRRATAKLVQLNKSRRKGSTMAARKRKRTRRAGARRTYRRNAPKRVARRRTRVTASQAGRRLARRRWHGNAPVMKMVQQGVMDAATVTGGKIAANLVGNLLPSFTPANASGITRNLFDLAHSLVGAGVVAFAGSRFLSRDRARFVVAGALTAPIEGLIRSANLPILSAQLGLYAPMGAYAPAPFKRVTNGGAVGAPRSGMGLYAPAPNNAAAIAAQYS